MMVWPSRERSSEIQLPSSVVNLSVRVLMSGSEFVRVAARAALSFCAGVCARPTVATASGKAHDRMCRSDGDMDGSPRTDLMRAFVQRRCGRGPTSARSQFSIHARPAVGGVYLRILRSPLLRNLRRSLFRGLRRSAARYVSFDGFVITAASSFIPFAASAKRGSLRMLSNTGALIDMA